jgi:hypothetical protein
MSAEDAVKAGTEIARKYGENEDIQRKVRPEKVEPSYYRVELEKEGRSSWSGGWAGGRTR